MISLGNKQMRRMIALLAFLLIGPSASAVNFPSPTYQAVTVLSLAPSQPICTNAQSVLSTSGCLTVTGPNTALSGNFALFTSGSVIRDGGTPAASAFSDTTNAGNIISGTLPLGRIAALTFGSSVAGIVPASGGGTTNFLRADGTWAATVGSGNVTGPVSTSIGDLAGFANTGGTLLSDLGAPGTAAFANLGTSGATVPQNSGANTESGQWTFTLSPIFSALTPSTSVCTDGSSKLSTSACPTPVIGPVSSVNLDVAVWNGSSGQALSDGGTLAPSAFTNALNANNINSGTLNNARLNIGTSGATIPLNNGSPTESGQWTFSLSPAITTLSPSSALCTDSGSHPSTSCTPTGNPKISSTATANATVGTLPINATILFAIARETAGHNVTISFGTTSGASDVATPLTLTASTSSLIPATSFAKNWFSASATQAIFVDSGAWSSASVTFAIYYIVGP